LQAVQAFERGVLLLTRPSTTPLPFGTKRSGAKSPHAACRIRAEMIGVGAGEEALGHRVVPAVGEIVAAKVAAAHVDPITTSSGHARDRAVDGVDVALDQRVGSPPATATRSRIAGSHRSAMAISSSLDSTATGLHQIRDLLRNTATRSAKNRSTSA
jgi:hypothetical protein